MKIPFLLAVIGFALTACGQGGVTIGVVVHPWCNTGWCYSHLEAVCCPRSAPYACGGACYTYSGGGGCSSYETQCY